jgi:hypothetical protein
MLGRDAGVWMMMTKLWRAAAIGSALMALAQLFIASSSAIAKAAVKLRFATQDEPHSKRAASPSNPKTHK